MVRTKVIGRSATCGPVVVCETIEAALTVGPVGVFTANALLVIDEPPWTADFNVLALGLEPKERKFKAPYYTREPVGSVATEIARAKQDAAAMFRRLYPSLQYRDGQHATMRASWRPMITRGEPMHYDTYGGPNPLVTAYINISGRPRVYNVGPTLPQLCSLRPDEIRRMVKEEESTDDVLYELRKLGAEGKGPFGKCATVRVELAPGSIWLFNAKTLAHEVVYGEGAIGVSWEVPGAAEMPADIFRRML